jgi:hypothetical protein
MRPLIYVAAGFALLIVVIIAGSVAMVGGSISWIANKKVAVVDDPKAADAFRANFQTTCSNLATKRVDQSDYQAIALVKQVCACDANALIAIMKRNKGMTILELGKRLTSRDPEITRAFESCNQAYGIDVVPD